MFDVIGSGRGKQHRRPVLRYMDLQKRREELSRDQRALTNFRQYAQHNPRLFVTVGLILSIAADIVHHTTASYDTPFTPPPGEPVIWALPLWILAAAFLIPGVRYLRRWHPRGYKPEAGGEKQLLMAIRDAGGDGITPAEAALETSLTVDEAEEILFRLANRGHLHVESRDGTLHYVLPGSHSSKRKEDSC
jgi:hypothetical protein